MCRLNDLRENIVSFLICHSKHNHHLHWRCTAVIAGALSVLSPMAKSLHFTRLMSSSARMALTSHFFLSIKPRNIHKPYFFSSTPYPLQYDMIINRPTQSSLSQPRRRPQPPRAIESTSSPDPDFDSWVDNKLASEREKGRPGSGDPEMDKEKRKYYSKRRKRLYGSDSEDEGGRKSDEGFVELKPEVVEFDRLHQREEELYFYDTFAYPWEKDKHYKMVYQLEKKYYPDQGLDKAFLQPGESPSGKVTGKKKRVGGDAENCDDEKLVFFDEVKEKEKVEESVTVKKVEQFFKGLTKSANERGVASGGGGGDGEPFLVTRNGELPPRWDGPNGTVLLVNKPKGWTSFTVCGKLRRIVKVKKVGHAGTLDPMATGLLIVCVGRATKVVDRYQGMIKGYSGVFRLGEATSTLDADSPVIQREPWEHIKDDDIKKALTSFLGEIWQVPPMFSAIKVGGEKMYDKARRGETVELSPRRISIFRFDIERSLDDRQNLIFRVVCSKGTYIRSLCADLAKALGSCAHLTALRRDSIGEYSANDAWEFNELEAAITKNYF
uniref:tRNA pseudouridine(55) synthase n=2 Tax=Brassica oleracea var. oleracea TaxID=109376 RepID=A0A0D3EFJ2_BRAOL